MTEPQIPQPPTPPTPPAQPVAQPAQQVPLPAYSAPGAPSPYAYGGGQQPPVPGGPYGPYGQKPLGQGKAITSLVLGILALLVGCCFFISIPLGIAAVAVGAIALSAANKGTARGRGMAITGIVTGAIGLVVGIGMAILWNIPEFQEEFWSGYCEEDPTTFPDMCD